MPESSWKLKNFKMFLEKLNQTSSFWKGVICWEMIKLGQFWLRKSYIVENLIVLKNRKAKILFFKIPASNVKKRDRNTKKSFNANSWSIARNSLEPQLISPTSRLFMVGYCLQNLVARLILLLFQNLISEKTPHLIQAKNNISNSKNLFKKRLCKIEAFMVCSILA